METSWQTPSKQILPEATPIEIPGCPDVDQKRLADNISSALDMPVTGISSTALIPQAERPSSSTHFPIRLKLAPMMGTLELWIEKRDKQELLATFFSNGPVSESICEGFWTFICAKTLSSVFQNESLKKFSPQMLDGKGDAFDLDGAAQQIWKLEIAQMHFSALLIYSADFIESFKEHCQRQRSLKTSAPIAKDPSLFKLSARVGRVTIEADLLKKLSPGDWLALDQHSLEGETPVEAELFMKKKRVARGSLQSGEINITHLDL